MISLKNCGSPYTEASAAAAKKIIIFANSHSISEISGDSELVSISNLKGFVVDDDAEIPSDDQENSDSEEEWSDSSSEEDSDSDRDWD